jgi:hypothetical protein
MVSELIVFRGKGIRRTLFNDEWLFCVIDVIAGLTDSATPDNYLRNTRRRDPELAKTWKQIVRPISIKTDGGMQKLNCASTEGIFRIVQSISSPKAEPFKRWLAKVGYERIQEIEDPELAQKRMIATYKAKGHSDDWIDKRMRGIAIRESLVNEWDLRGVKGEKEYAILTSEIARATFGVTPSEHKKLKGLQRENLRDHMTDLELIFTMLGEASTTEIAKNTEAQGFKENKIAAKKGGKIAGDARKKLEIETGKKVVTTENFLPGKEIKQIQGKEFV